MERRDRGAVTVERRGGPWPASAALPLPGRLGRTLPASAPRRPGTAMEVRKPIRSPLPAPAGPPSHPDPARIPTENEKAPERASVDFTQRDAPEGAWFERWSAAVHVMP